MKNAVAKKINGLIFIFAAVLVVQGCDRNSSSDPLPDEPGGSVVLDIPDANSGEVIVSLSDVQGNVLDDVRVLVIDDAGAGNIVKDASEDQLSVAGLVQIRLNDFTGDGVVRMEVEKSGFLSNGVRLDVTGATSNEVDLVLTSIENTGEGINLSEASGDLQQGTIVVEAVDGNQANRTLTRVDLPQDTRITSEDGTVLSGNLTVTVAHYKSTEAESLAAFPGGFSVNIDNADEIDIPSVEGMPIESPEVIFQSAGFTAIEIIDEFGNKADKFDGDGIAITMEIPPSTVNPTTGNLIAAGDAIPIWSFDTDTANWRYEGTGTATTDGRGGLQVSYLADHLSYWNLDFPLTSRCNASLNFASNAGDMPNPFPVSISFRATEGLESTRFSAGWSKTIRTTAGSDNVTLRRAPASIRVSVSFSSSAGVPNSVMYNGSPYSVQLINLCDGGSFAVDYPPVDVEFFPINVSVQAFCENDSTVAPESLPRAIVYFIRDRDYIRESTDAFGNATLNALEGPGRLYILGAGIFEVEDINLTGPIDRTVNLGLECPVITGATGQG